MWTVIYIAPSEKFAQRIKDRLAEDGFLVKIRPSQQSKQYEILVPESELEEVREALSSIF